MADVVMMIRTIGGHFRPSRRVASLTIVAILVGGPVAADQISSNKGKGGRTFIVSCDCTSGKARNRVAAALRRQGGWILYRYEALQGFAVLAPSTIESDNFLRAVRRLPSVIDVREDGEMELH